MERRRVIALFSILVIIVLALILLLTYCGKSDSKLGGTNTEETEPTVSPTTPVSVITPMADVDASNIETPEAEVTPEDIESPSPDPSPTPTTSPSPSPSPTPTTKPSPIPTAKPSPSPTPYVEPTNNAAAGTLTAEGSFSSNTGTSLNMGVSWKAVENGDGTSTITITGNVTSYSLSIGSSTATISFAGYSTSCSTNSLSVDSNTITVNGLFSATLTVPSGTDGDMFVTWNFNGSYGDTAISSITASDYVYTS